MKKVIKEIVFPNRIAGFFLFNLGIGLLIYIFRNSLEKTLLAYISYALSFYSLIIFCAWIIRVYKYSKEKIKESKIYQLYQKNSFLITKISISFSLILNLIFGILKLGIGIYYVSWWFITFASYYLLLCFMRIYLVKNIDNHSKEYEILKHTGIILLFLNSILVGIIVLIIKQNQIINYDGHLIYLVSLYDFYLIISAIVNVVKHRKNHNPIIVSSKCINLTVAMVSMIFLEVAMIYQFGNNDSNFKIIMTASTGLAVYLINSFISIFMIIRANKNIKKEMINP